MTGNKKMVPLPPKPPSYRDLVYLKEILERGKVQPAIDRRYSLNELPATLRYLEKGHARGKIVITN